VIDEISFKGPKTKDFLAVMSSLGLVENTNRAKTLFVDSLDNENLVLSSRNVQKTKITNSYGVNIYDIVYHEKLVLSKAAVEELNNLLDPRREHGETAETTPAPKAKKAKTETPEAPAPAEEKPKAKKTAKPKAEKAPEAEAAPKAEIAPMDVESPAELPAGDDVLELPAAEEGESK